MRGYTGKFLEVDLSNESFKEVRFSEEVLRDYVGGRGLAAKILWDRLGENWERIDPLGPENILLVLTGPLTGFIPGTKVCLSGKSPQSNGMVGSTIAGEFGVDLKCAGLDGLIITGRAERPSYIFICDSHFELKDAGEVWGKRGRETARYLVKRSMEDIKQIKPGYGEFKEPSSLYIGPAGENKTRVAAVVSKYSHGAGYGGYGGVMGSKNLKAMVVKGFGPLPDVYDPSEVLRLYREFSKRGFQQEHFRRWGTGGGGWRFGFETSSEPIRNWQEEWHNVESYKGEEFDKHWVKKYWGDFGCPMTCLKLACIKDGPFKGAICDNPDYEFESYMGTNLGVFKPVENIYLAYLGNDLGLCGIQAGGVLGFAGELYQRGILTKDDLDGLALEWGDAKAFAALAEKVALREGVGDILAEGVYRAALKIGDLKGVDLSKYAVHEKGIAIGAHGVRSGKDFAHNISYACSVQAGDHTSLASIRDYGSGEAHSVLNDSMIACNFAIFGSEDSGVIEFYSAVTGWRLTEKEWYREKALRILQIQRAMLLLGGPDASWRSEIDDENPQRFWEPLPSGPFKGKTVDRQKFESDRARYYTLVGWDEKGLPKPETLRRLGLGSVEAKFRSSGIIC
ncbi:aldehyde ferredoxin oxidoreductase [Candidatus Bathyarchaeota archaeon]|nr:aldehyde ferredoxin oxidoreductase [Candidatus Bathyarchaeota archaeon]MBS7630499.1 aldehyde ferredoxin oxidoreductase [Candidatus Bathyarchaeota archaeon]